MKRRGTEVGIPDIYNDGFSDTEGLPSCMRFTPCTRAGDLGVPVADGLLVDLGEQIEKRKPYKPSRPPKINLENIAGKL